jgi:predicted P-loop ATPase
MDALNSFGQWRKNVWTKQLEIKEGEDKEWRDVTDDDDSTYITRLKLGGLNVSKNDMIDMASSRDFAPEYDACKEYLASLKPWEEFGSADAIDDMFRTHLILRDEDNADFIFWMHKKWFVNMVAMMLGLEDENPVMPVYEGTEHIGKTFIARHLLPPELMSLKVEVSPAQQKDKDFLLTLSDTPLLLFDELEINGREANTLKHAITSNDSYVRASYGRKSQKRKRRASLIATTNDRQFLPDMEGRRRFLVVSITGTEKWEMTAEEYAEVYAQAVYLVHDENFNYKPTKEEALHISELNRPHRIPNDCEAVLNTLLRKPQGMEKGVALSAGDIICLLKTKNLGGHDYNTVNIGKAMTNMEFASKTVHGYTKYLCVVIEDAEREKKQAQDAELI